MSPDEYIKDRLDAQIDWYDSKSRHNQQWFKWLRIAEILFATSIPFLVIQIGNDTSTLKLVVGAMGVCLAVISGLVTLYKFQENWLEYRTTAEMLKHEKYHFLTNSPPYDEGDAFHEFVAHVESLISRENITWATRVQEQAKEKKTGK